MAGRRTDLAAGRLVHVGQACAAVLAAPGGQCLAAAAVVPAFRRAAAGSVAASVLAVVVGDSAAASVPHQAVPVVRADSARQVGPARPAAPAASAVVPPLLGCSAVPAA